ncbi:MFS transporter [Geminicoccaceae bacterium 1502E]|nr:MFS transporter [Geminicoccaceae bacterium 1502E]
MQAYPAPAPTASSEPTATRRQLAAWALYDWANSPFSAVIVTFVFAAYFTRAVAADEVSGTTAWSWTMAASGIVLALVSPVLGAIADAAGRRKPWLVAFTLLAAVATAALWLVAPAPAFVVLALLLVALANTSFELAGVFYNAMLPDLAPASHIGRWSGWAWGLGYAGGLAMLVLVLFVFVQPETPPFGLDKEAAEQVRIAGPLVAAWLLAFSLPLFLVTPDRPSRRIPLRRAAAEGVERIVVTFRHMRQHGNLVRFLVARMLYNDGLNTLFAFGGIYAAGTFGMDVAEVIQFGIALNVTAGIGAFAFAPLDDRLGSKTTVLASLCGLVLASGAALLAPDKTVFWVAALALGIFVGPVQAASRTMMARLAPPDMRTEMFGFYALTGKITAFIGPFLLGMVTWIFASQRAGMSVILLLLVAGFVLLLGVREKQADISV